MGRKGVGGKTRGGIRKKKREIDSDRHNCYFFLNTPQKCRIFIGQLPIFGLL